MAFRKNARRVLSFFLAAICLALCVSCAQDIPEEPAEYCEKTFFSMDTFVTVRLSRKTDAEPSDENEYLTDEYLESLINGCEKICADIESTFSRTLENSTTVKLNGNIDIMLDASEEFTSLLTFSKRLAEITDGAFDPTIGTLSVLWNVTGGGPVPDDDKITEALSHVGYDKITVSDGVIRKSDSGTMVDFGGVAKGYAAQKMLEYLSESKAEYGLVSVGGNVGVFGQKPGEDGKFKVGICSPDNTSEVVGYVFIGGGFVSVSGDYERYFIEDGVRYHHIFDSKTGAPAKTDIRSVAVISSNGASADALSTALFVMGYEKAIDFYTLGKIDFEAVFVLSDGRVLTTAGLGDGTFMRAEQTAE